MEAFWGDAGLGGLFALSFCAATLLPLGSEWLLALLIAHRHDPVVVVGVATVGNSCGAVVTYLFGRWGSDWFVRRLLRIDAVRQARAEARFRRYGRWALLFSWLPVIGDPLCLAAGLLRAPPLSSFFLVVTGKLARYAVVAWLTVQALGGSG